jgi:hypothetical protein
MIESKKVVVVMPAYKTAMASLVVEMVVAVFDYKVLVLMRK